MRRHIIIATVALLLAAAPAALAAPKPAEGAKAACKAEKHGMGTKVFKQTYGGVKSAAKAMEACIADPPAAEDVPERVNAAQTCKAQRKEDEAGFADEWGTKRNAFGKCVSATARA